MMNRTYDVARAKSRALAAAGARVKPNSMTQGGAAPAPATVSA
jgi:hypothetical protein